ncbi:MAG: hypothetical protein JJU34_00580 [Lunatimonas sp.]|uniref:hypothetical protein n=1 Tax=Lunatimonas sp. TaxID=2060141 RepID=UPI00263B5906|nr:hypothetical protein [Lunatimonas sp.]MCC5935749.1 hypothetical protein [Lunatimonas sp.]
MGKFIDAKHDGVCVQTKQKIKKGDHIFYFPGRGMFHADSSVYQEHLKNGSFPSQSDEEKMEGRSNTDDFLVIEAIEGLTKQ